MCVRILATPVAQTHQANFAGNASSKIDPFEPDQARRSVPP
jgi:hypothetical protein